MPGSMVIGTIRSEKNWQWLRPFNCYQQYFTGGYWRSGESNKGQDFGSLKLQLACRRTLPLASKACDTYSWVHAGIAEVGCRNMTYRGNHLSPYPSTLGTKQELPLMSSIGDGISVRGARSGPTIVGNSMRGYTHTFPQTIYTPYPSNLLYAALDLLSRQHLENAFCSKTLALHVIIEMPPSFASLCLALLTYVTLLCPCA